MLRNRCQFMRRSTAHGWSRRMRRASCVVLVVATTIAGSSGSLAAGSFQTKPAFPYSATTGTTFRATSISASSVPARAFISACGRGRVRDPQANICRGPADVQWLPNIWPQRLLQKPEGDRAFLQHPRRVAALRSTDPSAGTSCWPAPETTENMNMNKNKVGNLGLSDNEEDALSCRR
jgi:hypothetical protein